MEDRLKELSEVKVSDIMVKDPLFSTPDEKISATELIISPSLNLIYSYS